MGWGQQQKKVLGAAAPSSRPGQGCSVASLLSGAALACGLRGWMATTIIIWMDGMDLGRALMRFAHLRLGLPLCWAGACAGLVAQHQYLGLTTLGGQPKCTTQRSLSLSRSPSLAGWWVRERSKSESVWSVICGVEWLDGLWFLSAVACPLSALLISSLVQAESDPPLCALWSAWDPSNADFAIAWTGEANNCPSIRRTPYRSPSSIALLAHALFFPAAHPSLGPTKYCSAAN